MTAVGSHSTSQDNDGDENFHVYAVDLALDVVRDLTPFQGIKAQVLLLRGHEARGLATRGCASSELLYRQEVSERSALRPEPPDAVRALLIALRRARAEVHSRGCKCACLGVCVCVLGGGGGGGGVFLFCFLGGSIFF